MNCIEKRIDQYVVTPKSQLIKHETTLPDETHNELSDSFAPTSEVQVIETMEELNNFLDSITPVKAEQLEEAQEQVQDQEQVKDQKQGQDQGQEQFVPVKTKYVSFVCATNSVSSKLRLTVPFSIDLLRQVKDNTDCETSDNKDLKHFLARINPDDTDVAEAELSRQINQQDFAKVYYITFHARLLDFTSK